MLIVREMYGLKFSGADFMALTYEQLHDFGYRTYIADPDVWVQPEVKSGGCMYYECVIFYVDDLICISDYSFCTIKVIQDKLNVKGAR